MLFGGFLLDKTNQKTWHLWGSRFWTKVKNTKNTEKDQQKHPNKIKTPTKTPKNTKNSNKHAKSCSSSRSDYMSSPRSRGLVGAFLIKFLGLAAWLQTDSPTHVVWAPSDRCVCVFPFLKVLVASSWSSSGGFRWVVDVFCLFQSFLAVS